MFSLMSIPLIFNFIFYIFFLTILGYPFIAIGAEAAAHGHGGWCHRIFSYNAAAFSHAPVFSWRNIWSSTERSHCRPANVKNEKISFKRSSKTEKN